MSPLVFVPKQIWIQMLQQQLEPKIKDTSPELMKMYIFICARIQRKNKLTFPNVKTETKQMHTQMFQKRKHATKVMILNRINSRESTFLASFCLASDPQRKTSVSQCRSIWKRPNSRQPVFRPEVPFAPSTRMRPVLEAKFNLKNYSGWNANSYIHNKYELFSLEYWFVLVSLFNGISTFMGYLMPKKSL